MKTFFYAMGLVTLLSSSGCLVWHHDDDDRYREHVRYREYDHPHHDWDDHHGDWEYRHGDWR